MKKIDLRNTLKVYKELELFVEEMFYKRKFYLLEYSFSIEHETIVMTTYMADDNGLIVHKKRYEYTWNHFLSWLNNKQKRN